MSKCIRCHKEDGECIELKPCPFCGGKAKLHTDGITAISCINCGMFVNNEERSIIKLKGQWNTRDESMKASLRDAVLGAVGNQELYDYDGCQPSKIIYYDTLEAIKKAFDEPT